MHLHQVASSMLSSSTSTISWRHGRAPNSLYFLVFRCMIFTHQWQLSAAFSVQSSYLFFSVVFCLSVCGLQKMQDRKMTNQMAWLHYIAPGRRSSRPVIWFLIFRFCISHRRLWLDPLLKCCLRPWPSPSYGAKIAWSIARACIAFEFWPKKSQSFTTTPVATVLLSCHATFDRYTT